MAIKRMELGAIYRSVLARGLREDHETTHD